MSSANHNTAHGEKRRNRHFVPDADDYGSGASAHGGLRWFSEEEDGGEVPALASSLHMLEGVVFGLFRLKARPWNAAIFA